MLLLMQALLGKAAAPGEAMRPADLGQLDAAVEELPQLPVRGTDAARGVLLRSEALVEDALQEVGASIAEATDKAEGEGAEGEEEGEDEEGEEGELFAQPAFSAPLQVRSPHPHPDPEPHPNPNPHPSPYPSPRP